MEENEFWEILKYANRVVWVLVGIFVLLAMGIHIFAPGWESGERGKKRVVGNEVIAIPRSYGLHLVEVDGVEYVIVKSDERVAITRHEKGEEEE